MKVESGNVVTLTYDITNEAGEIIESSDLSGPVTFLVGKGAIIKGLDRRIIGMGAGDEADLSIPAAEAFGRLEDAPRKSIPRAEFPKDAKLTKGLRFEAGLPGAAGQTIVLEVLEANDETVETRILHPLAGQTIGMSIKIVNVRVATKAETEAGRAIGKPPPPPPAKK